MTAQRPRASRLQFSLRAVLVVLTLAAVAGWWWQKRFREESTIKQTQFSRSGVQVVDLLKSESKRRQGLRDSVLDGPTTIINEEGKLIREEQWRRGLRHGIYRRWNDAGDLLCECEFNRGRLVRVGDRLVANFLPPGSAGPSGEQILQKLHGDADFDYLDSPLSNLIEDMSFQHNLAFGIDSRSLDDAAIDIGTPITIQIRKVPLFVALIELLAPLGLECAYRYEMLWVTTPGSVLHDDKLAPHVITDHASDELLSKLSKPTRFDYLEQPLGAVLEDISFNNKIAIDCELKDESEQVTSIIQSAALRSALGTLLYTHELRCEAIGDKLVFTEVEGKKPRPQVSRDELPKADPATDSFSDPVTDPSKKDAPSDDPFSQR